MNGVVHEKRTTMRSAVTAVGLALCLVVGHALAADEKPGALRWDKERIRDYPIYRLLVEGSSRGTDALEHRQWERAKADGKPLVNPKREPNLRALIARYPDSDYADDAALLLARAQFFYHGDVAGAIEGLYEVIKKYPKGTWLAEDLLFLRRARASGVAKDGHLRPGWYGDPDNRCLEDIQQLPDRPDRDEKMRTWQNVERELTYFEYGEREPNLTADEARYWIAWIILNGDAKERFAEAKRALQELIEARRPERRTLRDLTVAKELEYGEGITKWMYRTERRAHWLLIDLYMAQEREAPAKAAAEDYLSLHAGHRSCGQLARMMKRHGIDLAPELLDSEGAK